MDLQDLRFFASVYVRESDLQKDHETYFLDFIKEANEYDIINLLMLGEAKHISNERGEALKELFTEWTGPGYILEHINEPQFLQEILPTGTIKVPFPKLPDIPTVRSPGDESFVARLLYGVTKKVNKALGKGDPSFSVGKYDVYLNKADAQAVDGTARKIFANAMNLKMKAGQLASKGAKLAGQHQKEIAVGIGAAAIVAVASLVVRKLAQRYASKAARACKGKGGLERTACIQKFKVDAVKDQMKVLDDYKKYCKAAKKPQKCEKKIDKKKEDLKRKFKN